MPLDEPQPLVLDANVALDFVHVGEVELLLELFAGRLLMPDLVEVELREDGERFASVERCPLDGEGVAALAVMAGENPALGNGELAAIRVAEERGAVVLINDRQARELGRRMGLECHGTLGILEWAMAGRRIEVDRAEQVFEAMLRGDSWFGADIVAWFRGELRRLRAKQPATEPGGRPGGSCSGAA